MIVWGGDVWFWEGGGEFDALNQSSLEIKISKDIFLYMMLSITDMITMRS